MNPPECIGIILDGNRRWAKEHRMPTIEGHRRGFQKLKEVLRWARERGIKHVVVYGFSTENWERAPEEVEHLIMVLREAIAEAGREAEREKFCLRIVGQRERFPEDVQKSMYEVEEKTARNTGGTVWVCLSYGARAEIVQAARAAGARGEITNETLAAHLWTAGMPSPDLIIRTGGEKRLSNFLLWQAAYSELFFIDTYWPVFTRGEFESILEEYAARERRHGR